MVPPYLVAQDGLLHQPRVTVQADPGIAPAPHLREAAGAAVPDLLSGGGTPRLQQTSGPGSQTLTASVSSGEGARRSQVWILKMIEPKYDWKTSQPEFRTAGRRGGEDKGWRSGGPAGEAGN